MGNYASAYEEYYKNINNRSRGIESKNKYPSLKSYKGSSTTTCGKGEINYFTKNYWIRRVERELAGALILFSCFMGLKYTKVQQFQTSYIWCRQALFSEFNYDESVEAFNTIELGDLKVKDIRIGDFKFEDLKSENIKAGIENFKEYFVQLRGKSI